MERINCSDCNNTFCSRYNLLRHRRHQHDDRQIIRGPAAHLGAPPLGAHFGAPSLEAPLGVPPLGAHLGAPPLGAHLGAPPLGAPLGVPPLGAHLGAPPLGAPLGAHLGAPPLGAPLGAHLGAHLGTPSLGAPLGAHLGAPPLGAHFGTPGAPTPEMPLGAPEDKAMSLRHPFTMTISGLTACGKTTFVKDLLQHHSARIQPTIQRIVWLYKRWQPLYTLVQRTVSPPVQFIQGIPGDIDDDDFFDPTINNLLVIDDLFAEAGKDKRITDLFTEGSHHRSLSVIGINQNLFGTKDPTQRRNCHYLILFKNPVDSQAMMTLARQMYPGQSEIFMKEFNKATKRPYGFLLIDLKPFTPDEERLKNKVMWTNEQENQLTNQEPDEPPRAIKEVMPHTLDHSSVGVQTVNIEEGQQDIVDKMNSCDDCGLLFDTAHDVQRHVKRGWCAESEGSPVKKRKLDRDATETESTESVEDNEGYLHLWELAQKEGRDRYKELYDQYVSQGENEEDASDMAEERVKPFAEKTFLNRYSTLLEKYWIPLRHNAVHETVLQHIQTLTDKGVTSCSAVKRVLRKVKPKFDDLFDTEVSEDEQDSDDEESTDGDSD